MHGPSKTYAITIPFKSGKVFHINNAKYENAFAAVQDSLRTTTNEKTIERLNQFYEIGTCPRCHGNRFNPKLLSTHIVDMNIAEVASLTFKKLINFFQSIIH